MILLTLLKLKVLIAIGSVKPVYSISLGDLADRIYDFHLGRESLAVSKVGEGLARALYSTYMSYLAEDKFSYEVPCHTDKRGSFVEFLKTRDSGQISYFSALPGVTRGQHYHRTKSEKFLVLRGQALFRFRDLDTEKIVEIRAEGGSPKIVDSILAGRMM